MSDSKTYMVFRGIVHHVVEARAVRALGGLALWRHAAVRVVRPGPAGLGCFAEDLPPAVDQHGRIAVHVRAWAVLLLATEVRPHVVAIDGGQVSGRRPLVLFVHPCKGTEGRVPVPRQARGARAIGCGHRREGHVPLVADKIQFDAPGDTAKLNRQSSRVACGAYQSQACTKPLRVVPTRDAACLATKPPLTKLFTRTPPS